MATTMNVNNNGLVKKKIVYNLYRDMLGSYNDKANDIIATLPQHMVREDHGITQQLESIIQTSQNRSDDASPQFGSVPPPPPPPGPGNIPSKRLSTEIPDRRLEPPPCVQNAMMTKDKKPFTYTPGGLDLSQIRSPRMARRISRNAHAEGTSSVPQPSPLAMQNPPGPLPPAAVAAMQAQLPVQVFPAGPPPPPPPPPSSTNNGHIGHPVAPQPAQNVSPVSYQRPEIKIPANPTGMLRPTHGPHKSPSPSADQVSNQTYDEEETHVRNKPQLGSIYIPPIGNQEPQMNKQVDSRSPPTKHVQSPSVQRVQSPSTPLSPTPNLNKAPTPWLTNRPQPQANVPAWAHREESQSPTILQSPPTVMQSPMIMQSPPISQSPTGLQSPTIQNKGGARIIPIQIEGRPSVLQKRPEQMQPQVVQQPAYQEQHSFHQQQHQQQMKMKSEQPGTRIIPIQIEGSFTPAQDTSNSTHQQLNRQNSGSTQHGYQQRPQFRQQFSSPMPTDQMRKLQLAEEDRALMNKFKNQVSEEFPTNYEENPRYRGGYIPSRVFKLLDESVDEDNFLHNESDPRYRGAAIPSRAFRMLQTMTDTLSGPPTHYSSVPRGPSGSRTPQMRQMSHPQSDDGAEMQQPYIPPSEQTVAEPRKYTGAAIPSRSFRILQAMTAPENCGPGQSDL